MDYYALLVKYINIVKDAEGVDFVLDCSSELDYQVRKGKITPEERDALIKAAEFAKLERQ